jgi:hypothetical protein
MAASAALALTGPAGLQAQAPAQITIEDRVDRPGADYRDFDLPRAEPALCRKACEDDGQCVAFTYVRPGVQSSAARCWLKEGVPEPEPNDCCASGVKSTAETARPANGD